MAQLHQSSPPGFMTTTEAAAALGISRQLFHQSLAASLDRWQVGPGRGTLLFRAEDVARLCEWLAIRRQRVEAGELPVNHPLRLGAGRRGGKGEGIMKRMNYRGGSQKAIENIKPDQHYKNLADGKVFTGQQIIELLAIATPYQQAAILLSITETDEPVSEPGTKYGV
jgi:hypothetical protein